MKNMARFLMVFGLFVFIVFPVFSSGGNTGNDGNIRVLLMMDDNLGSTYEVTVGKIKSIKSQLESFGWELTEAGTKKELSPCPWGVENFNTQPFKVDILIGDIDDMKGYHGLIILPGRSFENLMNSKKVLKLIREAVELGMPVAAWCRGVRLLAAADVIRGKRVIGNINHLQEYKNAGGRAVEYSVEEIDGKRIFKNISPPIIDDNIITTVRSLYYRNQMCQLIKKAVEGYYSKK